MSSTFNDEYYQRRMHAEFVPLPKGVSEVLYRDFGFSLLPDKYDKLNRFFNEMERVLQISFGREQRMTFAQISANVEKNSGRKFTTDHLAQINSIYPEAYTFKWEKPRNKRGTITEKWDLVVKQNVQGDKDISAFILKSIDGEQTAQKANSTERTAQNASPSKVPSSPIGVGKLISPTKARRDRDFILRSPTKKQIISTPICSTLCDKRMKMDAKRMLWRKMIFRHLLVTRVREAHQKFLDEKKLCPPTNEQMLHSDFQKTMNKIVPEISGTLPQKPVEISLRDTDIRSFLQSVKPNKNAKREKTPEKGTFSISKSEPQTPVKTNLGNVKAEPQTPKTPMEQRLRAKFAAKTAFQNVDEEGIRKRRAMLYRMKEDILEVIRAHLNLNKASTVALSNRELLQKLGREVNPGNLLEHLQLLCEIVPKNVCRIESTNSSADQHHFKLHSDVGPDWLQKVLIPIKEEIDSLDLKLGPSTIPKSPSSLF
ncbi:hypothetical protein niasHS_010718 [Heterodera schachtii]|uniref:CDT1 Geminin-binding domain-containing protein n=1 Tax=Heterodera schachtii TaxID=97005 RepID=A0ABD2IZI7_HETSC